MVGDKAAAMTGVVGEGELCPLHLEQEQDQNSYETSETAKHWYCSRWPFGPTYPLQVMLLIPTIAKRRISTSDAAPQSHANPLQKSIVGGAPQQRSR
jgi:hypothetical protein